MISFLEGKIEYLGEKFVILNAGGVGYRLSICPKLVNSLSNRKPSVNPSASSGQGILSGPVKLFVHSQMNMREGTFDLYGFDKKEDLELFHLLKTVSGIGPKNAMGIMATLEPKHLKAAIMKDDADYLKKIAGLGPKTAQRLILELKNKVDYIDIGDMKDVDLGQEGQAMEALLVLGYSPSQAKDALKEAGNKKTLEEKVREALKLLGKK